MIPNNIEPYFSDFREDSETMLIAFGGIAGELGIPAFEFFKSTDIFAVKKIYFRDLNQAWYHQGIAGIANNIDEIANFLINQISKQNVKYTVIAGNSMGGYAALLFGWLINATRVLAFSPQTFITTALRLYYRDFRWSKQIKKAHQVNQKQYFDLKKLFLTCHDRNTIFNIYYPAKDYLDRTHASRMKNIQNIRLFPYEYRTHSLVKELKIRGDLDKILHQNLVF
jgi:hypothetical protein